MSPTPVRRTRRAAASVAGAAVLLIATVTGAQPVEATWSDEVGAAGTVEAATLAPVALGWGCVWRPLADAVDVPFTMSAHGASAAGVVWALHDAHGALVGRERTLVGANLRSIRVPIAAPEGVPAGTYELRISAAAGAQWRSEPVVVTVRYADTYLFGARMTRCGS